MRYIVEVTHDAKTVRYATGNGAKAHEFGLTLMRDCARAYPHEQATRMAEWINRNSRVMSARVLDADVPGNGGPSDA